MSPSIGTATTIQLGPLTVRCIIEGQDTAGTHSVQEVIVPAGARLPVAHSHDAFEETFLGTQGVITVTIEGHDHRLSPGDGVCTLRGEVHTFRNDTDTEARFLAIAAPGHFGRAYFEDMRAAMIGFGDGPPNPQVLMEVMRRHGLTPAPPA